ncbi:transglutaminase family protein [Sphingomonas jatrophae]|uniref:Transglutaminase-like enzyme, putative cysteine protease n=1 Tax=Sphingomonas jatrophae TaxID=1166337 RepID=A0A1I6KYC9_9SPHN|nr:transglutaminase family protein [Sphingomonas jatrophae]SFR96222.1 Transglutaminase-like enzyme, putative cysteine protease [Sphingomonas jatrophae]
MRYAVTHRTRFRYEHPVRFARCNLRLKPVAAAGQTLESHALTITPAADSRPAIDPGYPVEVRRVVIDTPARDLVIESRATLSVGRVAPAPAEDDASVATVAAEALACRTLDAHAPANYLYPSPLIPLDPAIAAYAAQDVGEARGVVDAVLALTRRIRTEFRYDGNATAFDTPPADAFAKRHGVCQDFAQVMISGLRGLGLPAAYVSGYLRTIPPPGKPRLVGVDATHAWVDVWCGNRLGWLGFDPTNGCTVGADHIVTAIGRDYGDVAPIDGIFMGQDGQRIEVSVDVEPLA